MDTVFPPACRACATLFTPRPSAGAVDTPKDDPEDSAHLFKRCFNVLFNQLVCPSCRQRFIPVHSPMCPDCGVMFVGRQGDDHLCGRCLEKRFTFDRARAVGLYDHTLLQLIHAFKYSRRLELARPLSRLLETGAQYLYQNSGIEMVVPVPMYPRKLRRRGFNPPALLVRPWAERARVNDTDWRGDDCVVTDSVLGRTRDTASQTGLRRPQRWENVRGAFEVRHADRVRGKHILLVDDVLTTGATADTCARALYKNGARRVDVLTLAQAA